MANLEMAQPVEESEAKSSRASSPPSLIPLVGINRLLKTSLQQAARDGREDIVRQHLQHLAQLPTSKKGKLLNAKDTNGFTALHYAAKCNRFKILQLLVTSGANADIKTTAEQLTALHLAARYLPRYQDRNAEAQEQGEVTSTCTSRYAVQLLITYCRVEVNVRDVNGITPLHMACSRGNLAALEVLIQAPGIQLTLSDNNDDTPLHEACLAGDPEVVEMLLKSMKAQDLSLLLRNDERQTPLHIACKQGSDDIVKLILRYGFEERRDLIRAYDNKYNAPLHLACEGGNAAVVRVLLLNGADIETTKEEEVTPLHIAACLGFVEIAKILVSVTKEIVEASDAFQQTPLHRAAHYNQCGMINFLLDHCADIDALDNDSYTPLLVAAAHGQTDAMKLLIERGAPIDDLDKDGKSVVFIASEENHQEVLKALLSNPIGMKLCRTVDSTNNTPLHIACKVGNIEAVQMLLRANVKINARNEFSKTPMHLAAENGHISVVHELIRYKHATIQDKDEDSNSPLHIACIHGHVGVAKVLIAANCDIKERNATLWTPMDCAAAGGFDQLVAVLIKAEADVNPTDRGMVAPLHLAAREGHVKVLQLLLKNEADITITDADSNNALDLAIDNGHKAVALAIIHSPMWEAALRNCTYPAWGGITTPLRKLIRKMPEVAKEVFNNCIVTNATKDGEIRPDSRKYKVFFNYEFLEDFRDLARSFFQDYTDGDDEGDLDSESQPRELSEDAESVPMDMITKLRRRTDHRFTTSWGPIGFRKDRHPLSIMVDSAQIDLLKHPLVSSLLSYKWRTYGRWLYIGNLVIYALFLLSLTIFALTLPNPESMTCKAVLNGNFGADSNLTITNSSSSEKMKIAAGKCDSVLSTSKEGSLYFMAIVVIISSSIRLLLEFYQMISLRVWKYFLDWINWIELTLFTSSIIFVSTFQTDCLCPQSWQWQLGALSIFLGWINLIIFIRKLPLTGIYIVMFVDVFYTFCRLLFLSILLLVAFGLSFYMAFNEPDLERTPFSSPGRALIKTMTMTTGEFNYDGIFRNAAGGIGVDAVIAVGEIAFPQISYLLWIIFIILMPILLTNLLVGLAVGDIKDTLETAELKRLGLLVELVLTVEEQLPKRLRRYFIVGSREILPNRSLTLWEMVRNRIWGRKRFKISEKISNALNPPQVQSQTRSLHSEVDHVKLSVAQLTERSQRMEEMLGAIIKHLNIKVEDETSPFPRPTSLYHEPTMPPSTVVAAEVEVSEI